MFPQQNTAPVIGAVTLEQMLAARETRAVQQQQYLMQYRLPLLSVTMVIPGAEKNSVVAQKISQFAENAIHEIIRQQQWSVKNQQRFDLITGSELYYSINQTAEQIKKRVIELEETHPLGRLWDMDVINVEGKILSRRQFGFPPRRCLLCEDAAHICGRSRRHTVDALLVHITQCVQAYEKN